MGAPRCLPNAVHGTVDRVLTALAVPIPTTGTRGLEIRVAIYRAQVLGFQYGRAYAVTAASPAGVWRRGAWAVGHTGEAVLAVALANPVTATGRRGTIRVVPVSQSVAVVVVAVGTQGFDGRRAAAILRAGTSVLAAGGVARAVATADDDAGRVRGTVAVQTIDHAIAIVIQPVTSLC